MAISSDPNFKSAEVMTPDDFEREFHIPRNTQAVMRRRGQVPFYRLGGGKIIRYSRAEIEQWFAARAAGGGR